MRATAMRARLATLLGKPARAVTRRAALRLAALGAAAALAACDVPAISGAVGGTGRPAGEGPVRVALLVPYESARASDAAVARSLENAARLAAADLGGGVQIDVFPTQGTPQGAGAAAEQAATAGAQVILGPLYAENAAAVGVAAAGSGIPVLSFSNNTAVAGGNVWVLGSTFENTARRVLEFAATQGRGRVLLTHSEDATGSSARDAVLTAARETRAEITGAVPYALSQAGIQAAAPAIAQRAQSTGATAVFLTGNTAGDLPVIAPLLREAGVVQPTVAYLGLSRWDVPAEALASVPALEGGYFALPDPGPSGRFAGRYRSAYGSGPHPLAGLAYDGVAAIGAIAQSGRTVGRATLTDRSGFAGTGGAFRLRADGTNDRALAVAQVVDRRAQIVSPAPGGFRGAGL